MLLQRGISLPVWGTAEPGDSVEVSISGQKASAVADDNGKWEVKLGPLTATGAPRRRPTRHSVCFRLKMTLPSTPIRLRGQWTPSTPEGAAKFSAVGYLFGKEILEIQAVPVGLIGTSWGGTPAKTWSSLETLKKAPREPR